MADVLRRRAEEAANVAGRERVELPGKAMAIVILAGLIMVFVGAAYALYSATKIVAWMVS